MHCVWWWLESGVKQMNEIQYHHALLVLVSFNLLISGLFVEDSRAQLSGWGAWMSLGGLIRGEVGHFYIWMCVHAQEHWGSIQASDLLTLDQIKSERDSVEGGLLLLVVGLARSRRWVKDLSILLYLEVKEPQVGEWRVNRGGNVATVEATGASSCGVAENPCLRGIPPR